MRRAGAISPATYTNGSFLPGGGVKRGETVEEALHRKLREETETSITAPALFGVHSSVRQRDHVFLYVVRAFEILKLKRPNFEIAEVHWFPSRTCRLTQTQPLAADWLDRDRARLLP